MKLYNIEVIEYSTCVGKNLGSPCPLGTTYGGFYGKDSSDVNPDLTKGALVVCTESTVIYYIEDVKFNTETYYNSKNITRTIQVRNLNSNYITWQGKYFSDTSVFRNRDHYIVPSNQAVAYLKEAVKHLKPTPCRNITKFINKLK